VAARLPPVSIKDILPSGGKILSMRKQALKPSPLPDVIYLLLSVFIVSLNKNETKAKRAPQKKSSNGLKKV
jgi:hypothetical protein